MSKLFIFFLSGSLVLCSGIRAMSEKLDSESTRVLEQYATNEKLLEQLLEVSVSQRRQIIESLEIYADKFVELDFCEELFAALPENIFKVMVRVRFFERYQRTIDVVKISEFYDRLKQAHQKNDGRYDFSDLNLSTLDGFVDILVLNDENHRVRDLTLWFNNLQILSSSLRLLPALKILDVLGNKIRIIPDWIGELKQLERLNVAQNQIAKIPDSIGELEHLTGLYLSGNYISTCGACISKDAQSLNSLVPLEI